MKVEKTVIHRKPPVLAMLPVATLGLGVAAPFPLANAQSALEEVVVTAQRREENMQQVPIAVAAFSQQALESTGVNATIALPVLVPSVQLVRSGPSAMFYVRGVGNSSGGTGEEGTNAFYVDGVFLPDVKQSAFKFNNIERIEVLKGPQGTLFGRNSSGGLINVITHEPGREFMAKLSVGAANYDTYTGQAYVAGPLTDTLSADVALTLTDQRDGWGDNRTTGRDVGKGWDHGIRSKWVLLPNDSTKITVAGEYAKSSDDFTTAFRLAPGAVGMLGALALDDPFDTNTPDQQFTDQHSWGMTLTAEFDLRNMTLTSITATRENRNHSAFDADTGPLTLMGMDLGYIELEDSSQSFQQEFRLASNSDSALSWQTGLFLLHTKAELDPQMHTGFAFFANPDPVSGGEHRVFSTLTTNSYALFGELSYALTPRTTLTAGARYTRDELDFDGTQQPVGANPRPAFSVDNKITEGEPTYRIALRYDITDNANLYASYNRGFKSGTYSMSSILVPAVEPQTIDAFEVGVKSQLLDDRLRLNLAAFYYDISDYQARSASGTSPTAVLLNAAEVDIEGVEAEFELAATDNLRIFGSATWLDAEFAEFDYAPFSYPRPAVCTPGGAAPGVTTGAPTGGALTCIGSAAGNSTPLAPEFAANLGISYALHLQSVGVVDLSVVYSYNDGYYFEPDNRLEQPAFSVLNASATYRPTEQWALELWGRNLENETYFVAKQATSLADYGVPAAPRTYGVNVKYTY
jgi:iron complex outermembrane receptor protein